jgi:hypothetical protein
MIAELSDDIRQLETGYVVGHTNLKTLFPEPAVVRAISLRDAANRRRRDPTFAMDPQQGSR